MATTYQRLPIKRLVAACILFLLACGLWAYGRRASIYALHPTPGHHVVYYFESSSGCLLLLVLWDVQSMDALPFETDFHGPITPVYRAAFFGHEDGRTLRPFEVFTSIQSSSHSFGFTVPYSLLMFLIIGYAALLIERWRRSTRASSLPVTSHRWLRLR